MRTAEVETRTYPAQLVAVQRAVLRPAEVEPWLVAILDEIADSLRRQAIVPDGFPLSIRHRRPDGLLEVEAGFPWSLPILIESAPRVVDLPAGPVAVTVHHGPHDEISSAYEVVADWLRRHHGQPAGDAWEIYHAPPTRRSGNWRTEIVQPYRSR